MKTDPSTLRAFAKASRSEYESTLEELVNIPSVSSEPDRAGEVRKCADLGARILRDAGATAEVIETGGHPLVAAHFEHDASAPTVTLYNHLDVQPADREIDGWKSDPFVFEKKGNKYLGRGTTDDKGPALAALWGIKAAREAGVPLNIRVLWELEEEIGSPNFEKTLRKHRKDFATESVIVSDTIWVARGKPASPAGLRGTLGFEMSLQTGTTDTHSGTTGGTARNPLGELMQIVSELYDARTGRVKLKGFYDDVRKPTRQELADFRSSGFSIDAFRKAHKLKSVRTDDDLDAMKRLWAQPTFEVHGVVGGYTGPGIKTVIPPKASVKISCRLVPDQDPKRIASLFKEWFAERHPDVRLSFEKSMKPYYAPIEGPLPDAIRDSVEFAFGERPVFIREGGSIGAVPSMEKVLDCPVVFLGLSLPEHGYHAPNENFDWGQASGGMIAFARFFDLVANGGTGTS